MRLFRLKASARSCFRSFVCLVSASSGRAKVILAGEIKRKVAVKGLLVSKGARTAIEAAGGSIELPPPAAPDGEKAQRRPGKDKNVADSKPKAE